MIGAGEAVEAAPRLAAWQPAADVITAEARSAVEAGIVTSAGQAKRLAKLPAAGLAL